MANIRTSSQEGPAKLAYVVDTDGDVFLAWEAMISYDNKEGPQRDRLFVDASGGNRLVRHPQHHYARNRNTYDANNGTSLPGTLVRTEDLTIEQLVERVRTGNFREVIMATNPTTEGDGTALFISNLLSEFPVKITRLARGITTGSVLEFTNKEILADAISGRQTL